MDTVSMDTLSPTAPPQPGNSMGRIFAIGAAIVALIVGGIFLLARGNHAPQPTTPDAYASRLQISDIKMSRAENLAGGTVTYIDGKVTNAGSKTVAGALVETTFLNSMNEVAQKEQSSLRVMKHNGVYDDAVELSAAPLGPGESAQFRLIFEHISIQWNQNFPEIRVLRVATK